MDNQFMSKPGLDGDQQRLYEIEKLVKIVEEQGQKFVIVKWKGFTSRENTKEPYEYIKKLRLSQEELQNLEQEYQQKNLTTVVNIKAKHKEYYHEYRTKIFPETKPLKRDRSWLRQEMKLSIEEKSRCKLKAYEQMKSKLQFGLSDLTTQDYIHFMNLHHSTEDTLKKMIKRLVFSKYDKILQEIKGLYRNEGNFVFYVQVEQDVYACALDEMKKYFPISLNAFLDEFNEYMRLYMKQDLQGHQKLCNGRFNRMKEVSKSKYITKMKKAFDIPKDPISFGFDEDDAMENRKNQLERKIELEEIKKMSNRQTNSTIPEVQEENIKQGQNVANEEQMIFSQGQEKKQVKQPSQSMKKSVVDEMYKEMLQTMNIRGIKSFLSFDQKSKSKKKQNTKQNQPVMEMQDFLNQSSNSSEESSSQVQLGNSKHNKKKKIHKDQKDKNNHSGRHMTLRKRKSNKSYKNSSHSQKSKNPSPDSKKSKSPNSKNGKTTTNNNKNNSRSPNSRNSSSDNKGKSKSKKSNKSPNSSLSSSGRQFQESEGRRGNVTPTRSSNRLRQTPRISYSTLDFADFPESEGSSSELRRSKRNKKV